MTTDHWFPRIIPSRRLFGAAFSLAGLFAFVAAEAQSTASTAADSSSNTEKKAAGEVVELSPFQVQGSTNGYYATNTLSGTRLNSKLEDLGASITVVTKQQMADFGLVDINDVFLYEAGTEGTGNFTDFSVDRNGFVVDNTTGGLGGGGSLGGPTGANRIRGIKQANVARGNFATSGRVPLDSMLVESVEISRGPNSSIFGLGNASGTLNILPIQANLQKQRTYLETRVDDKNSFRAGIDHNQVLIPGVLAVRVAGIHQENRFERKPSIDRSHRYDGMITYQPFKNTTLRASFEHYEDYARLPNSVTPRDGIGYWAASGSPTFDPVTWTVTRGGVKTVVPFANDSALGAGLSSDGNIYTRTNLYVNGDGSIGDWTVGRLSNGAAPQNLSGNVRLVQSAIYPRGPLDVTSLSLTDRSIYDWSSLNLAAPNWSESTNDNIAVELDQIFLNTPRHLIAAQAGWYREDSELRRWDSIGQSSESPLTVFIDVNERRLDGTPNPYFLHPYVGSAQPTNFDQPLFRDIYRAQLAYQLTLSHEKNWVHWLGDHTFSGYQEYNKTYTAAFRYRDGITSTHSWLPAGIDRSNGTQSARTYTRYYLGDGVGHNIDYATDNWTDSYGQRTLRWYNGATGQWVNENATLGATYRTGSTGSDPGRNQTVIKTTGGAWQSHFLNDMIVGTVGVRKDKSFSRNGTNLLAADGYSLEPSNQNEWPGDWQFREGRTTTKGVVVKPFRSLARGQGGVKGMFSELIQSLNFHYNEADSFQPEVLAQDLYTNLLPDPTGKGKDRGISFTLFDEKLVLRYNEYKTMQLNSREGQNGTIASRTARVEMNYNGNNDVWNLQTLAGTWVDTLQPGLSGAARDAAIFAYTKLPTARVTALQNYPIGGTSDVLASGREIEVNYNPSRFVTMKLAITQEKAVDSGISQELMDYLAERMPVWKSIIDPIRGTPWYTTNYGGSRPSPDFYINDQVLNPIKLAQANEGKTRTQIREWRANLLTTYRLAGITDQKWLKKVSLTGAVRWEGKANIGYYADANNPTIYDPNRPIFDEGHTNFDFGVSYRTNVLRDKAKLRVQLNVRNAFEGGRLQPVGALSDGTPHTYRIIDPRLFMLTTSLEF